VTGDGDQDWAEMNSILDFLNQPIVLTLITLTVGSYLLSLVAERRSRKDKLRDRMIDFLTEAGDNITQFVPHIYAQLHTGNVAIDQALKDGLKDLFAKRMSVQIGSQAYLKSEEFHQQYFQLLDQLTTVVACITEFEQGGNSEETVLKIRENRISLGESWPLADESLGTETGRPADELILWMDMIMHRTTHLLSSNLKSEMR
jgi:hypothetical protein